MFLHTSLKFFQSSVNLIGVHSTKWKPHPQISFRQALFCVGLPIKWLRNNVLKLPRCFISLLRDYARNTFNFLRGPFIWLNSTLMHNYSLSETLTKDFTIKPLTSSLDHVCLLVVPSIWSFLRSCILILVFVCHLERLRILKTNKFSFLLNCSSFTSLLSLCYKQQEEIFAWKFPQLDHPVH